MSGIALWVPGPWKDRSEFIKAVAATDSGVMAAGGMLVEAAQQRHAMFEVLDPNEVPDRGTGVVSSFGMKQFSLADASVEDDGEGVVAAWALFEFNIYLWRQQPSLEDGHTFSRPIEGAAWYRLKHLADGRYPEGHPYVNPQGVWELTFA